MESPSAKHYLWAELGALLGAIAAVPSAVGLLYLVVLGFHGESLEGLSVAVLWGFTIGISVLMAAASFGCWFALRRVGHPAPKMVAGMMMLLLVVTYLAAVASTAPGGDLQYEDVPAKFLPPDTLVPLAMPLVATWITGVVPKSVTIQGIVVLLLGLGAFVLFANPSEFFPPEPVATPTLEEESPVVPQLVVGSENPCWRGTYPDDLAILQEEHIRARDLFVDPQTNDIYESRCVVALRNSGRHWPPGVAARLVRASDL